MNTLALQTNNSAATGSWKRTPAASTTGTHDSFVLVTRAEDETVKVAADNPEEFGELYRTQHGRVLRLCRLLLSDPDEANDVTQDVFIKLYQARQTEERTMAWPAWLTRVAVNACRDRRRSGWWKRWREHHTEYVEADHPGTTFTPEQAALSNERRRAIWQALRELTARQQEVFVLRQLEGWSTDEVAETLGLSAGSIKRHLYRAVHQMRKALRGGE